MTPLEFIISVKNSEVKSGLTEVQQQVAALKQMAADEIEGPARESKIRTEVTGLIKDVALGKDPMYVFISSLERLSEVARFAIPAAVGLAVGVGLASAFEKASEDATELRTRLKEVFEVSPENMSVRDLRVEIGKLDDLAKDYADKGFLTKFLYGSEFDPLVAAAARLRDYDSQLIALRELQEETTTAQAKILLASANPADQLRGREMLQEQANSKAAEDVKDKQKDAEIELAKHLKALAELEDRYATQRYLAAHASRRVEGAMTEESYQASRAEIMKNITIDRAVVAAGNQDLAVTKQAGEDQLTAIQRGGAAARGADRVQQLRDDIELVGKTDQEKAAILQARIDREQVNPQLGQDVEATVKLLEDQRTLALLKVDMATKAARAEVDAAEKSAKLRQDATRAQFETLDKEDKLIVLRAEQARLEAELKRLVYSPDARAIMEKSLAEVTKDLNALGQRGNPLQGVNAYDALRGSMSSGVYGQVTNDAANRAEKQRDTMVGYLKTIATKSAGPDLDMF